MTLTHEEVVCVWNIATNAEEFHEVMELSVNVSAYLQWLSISATGMDWAYTYRDWGINPHYIAFFNEQLACFVA